MANIATVMTAAFVRPGIGRGQVTAHGLLRAMTRWYGSSYFVPIWFYDDYPNRRIYTQHGEKWSPHGVQAAWEKYGRFLQEIWVRWHDDGGDHDVIYKHDSYKSNACRYGFDEVRIDGVQALDSNDWENVWRRAEPGVWAARFNGSYLAGNDRCNLLHDYPARPSRTTPVRGRPFLRNTKSLEWALADMPLALLRLEPIVLACATEVKFLWRRRATRIYRRQDGHWWGWEWRLDDWDNCVDPGWLARQAT
jgi:hypothetical protein